MDPDNLLALRQIAAIHVDGDHLPIAWPTADERQRSRMFRVTTGDDLGCVRFAAPSLAARPNPPTYRPFAGLILQSAKSPKSAYSDA
jgi:hypothetical protein